MENELKDTWQPIEGVAYGGTADEFLKTLHDSLGLSDPTSKVEEVTWPGFDHSPENPEDAKRYYFNNKGEILPTPETAQIIAEGLLRPIFEPQPHHPKPTGEPHLFLLLSGDLPASNVIMQATIDVAIERYHVDPDNIKFVNRSTEEETKVLEELQDLRLKAEAGDQEASNQLEDRLKAIEREEYAAVEAVRENGGQISIRETNPPALEKFDQKDRDGLSKARAKARKVRIKHEIVWNLSSPPHPYVAEIDTTINPPEQQVTLEKEMREWILACERPLDKVLEAQEKLAGLMNRARQIRVIANPDKGKFATDVTLKTLVDDGQGNMIPRQWFNHAGYENNFPGSEVFGAPTREGGNGTIAYPYPVMFDDYLLPNVILHVKDGRVENWEFDLENAPEGNWSDAIKHFEEKMNDPEHPNNRYFGEIGIGTSPYPTFNTIDIGFNEKRVGIHFALGMCYANVKDEMGHMTNLDNGNSDGDLANIHADLVLPGSEENPVDMWIDIGTKDNPEWILVQHNGAFVKKLDNGEYQADEDMAILNALDANREPFPIVFPLFPLKDNDETLIPDVN